MQMLNFKLGYSNSCSDSSTKEDHETDSSTSKPSGHARISYPNDRLTDDSSLEGTDIEAEDNQRFQIQDSVLGDSSESHTSNKPSDTPGNKHTEDRKAQDPTFFSERGLFFCKI